MKKHRHFCPNCDEEHDFYVFRAYARRSLRDKRVVAECVDLNITVEADTLAEARRSLEAAVDGYLQIAFDRDDPSDLVPRYSPATNRMKYHCWIAAHDVLGFVFSGVRRSVEFFQVEPRKLTLHPVPSGPC